MNQVTGEHEAQVVPVLPRRRRRRLVGSAVAVVVCLGLAVPVTRAVQSPGTERTPAAAAVQSADVTAAEYEEAEPALRQILERRAGAVVNRDHDTFMADVDQSDHAFGDRQAQLIANLGLLDLAHWTYELSDARYGLPDLAKKYHGPAIIRVVVLHYGLDQFDSEPVSLPQAFTFVKRHGRWLIASDSDLDTKVQGGYFIEPWEHGPIAVARSPHALVITDAVGPLDADLVLATVDRALRTIRQSWPRRWPGTAVIVAVHDDAGIVSAFRPGLVPEGVAAVALPLPTAVPQFEAEPAELVAAGYRVVVLPEYVSSAGDQRLMTHELTHLATGGVGFTAPVWLVEGYAEHVATQGLPARSLLSGSDLPDMLRVGQLRLPAGGSFQGGRQVTNYALSALACRYIQDTFGRARLTRLLATWDRAAGARSDPDVRQQRALTRVLGVGTAAFERGLDAYVRRL